MHKGDQRKRSSTSRPSVFLNLPYDHNFESLFLAYIAGVQAFGMSPRATLEIPGSARRLDRILALIQSCPYSIHDLSRVQLDRSAPACPRFNMPFELGMAVVHQKSGGKHSWFVFETMPRRIMKSLSDLNGTDAYVHGGTINGVFAQLGNAFVRARRRPTISQMWAIYRPLRSSLSEVLGDSGANTIFEARPFQALSAIALALTNEVLLGSED